MTLKNSQAEQIRKQIQDKIESVCRYSNSVEISEFGFENLNASDYHNDDTIHNIVVEMLEKDGYTCQVDFSNKGGKSKNKLYISW